MSSCLPIVATAIFPPAGVIIKRGCNAQVLVNIALTSLFYFPGLIHGCYIVGKYNAEDALNQKISESLASTPETQIIITVPEGVKINSSGNYTQQIVSNQVIEADESTLLLKNENNFKINQTISQTNQDNKLVIKVTN
ncbi:hypothetical protein BB558_002341 [Smittium angustum]|uniref:Uncharacterized protein n=1 Tax=Smittium angustum TaxID=133377 RepID=A0A2U1J966_SMIAN|nr:hypothetical protein BB558_002341 [Smittium angustum]